MFDKKTKICSSNTCKFLLPSFLFLSFTTAFRCSRVHFFTIGQNFLNRTFPKVNRLSKRTTRRTLFVNFSAVDRFLHFRFSAQFMAQDTKTVRTTHEAGKYGTENWMKRIMHTYCRSRAHLISLDEIRDDSY